MNAPPVRLLYEGLCGEPDEVLDPRYDPSVRTASQIGPDWIVLTTLWAGTLRSHDTSFSVRRQAKETLRIQGIRAKGQEFGGRHLVRIAANLLGRARNLGLVFHPEAMRASDRDLFDQAQVILARNP